MLPALVTFLLASQALSVLADQCDEKPSVVPCSSVTDEKRFYFSTKKGECKSVKSNKCLDGVNAYDTEDDCLNSCIGNGPTNPSDLNCECSIRTGAMLTYDDTTLLIPHEPSAKHLMSRWDATKDDPCKYQLRVVTENTTVIWAGFGVGVHKNINKFYRNFAFERFGNQGVEMRGWKLQGPQDISTSLPFSWQSDAGETQVTVYGSYNDGYIINSTTCQYELRFNPTATGSKPLVQMSMNKKAYQGGAKGADHLRGWCMNCNKKTYDDFRRCDDLVSVRDESDRDEQIYESCKETDDALITI